MPKPKNKGLGRGLDSLFAGTEEWGTSIQEIAIGEIDTDLVGSARIRRHIEEIANVLKGDQKEHLGALRAADRSLDREKVVVVISIVQLQTEHQSLLVAFEIYPHQDIVFFKKAHFAPPDSIVVFMQYYITSRRGSQEGEGACLAERERSPNA